MRAHGLDRVVEVVVEEAVGEPEREGEDVAHPPRHRLGGLEVGDHRRTEPGRTLGPDVAGDDAGQLAERPLQVEQRRGDDVGTDVERLEQVGRRLHPDAVGQRLLPHRGVATVHVGAGRRRAQLLLQREVEELVHRVEHVGEHRVGDAVPGDLEEADLAAGGVDRRGDGGPVGLVAGRPAADVDDRDDGAHGASIRAGRSARQRLRPTVHTTLTQSAPSQPCLWPERPVAETHENARHPGQPVRQGPSGPSPTQEATRAGTTPTQPVRGPPRTDETHENARHPSQPVRQGPSGPSPTQEATRAGTTPTQPVRGPPRTDETHENARHPSQPVGCSGSCRR